MINFILAIILTYPSFPLCDLHPLRVSSMLLYAPPMTGGPASSSPHTGPHPSASPDPEPSFRCRHSRVRLVGPRRRQPPKSIPTTFQNPERVLLLHIIHDPPPPSPRNQESNSLAVHDRIYLILIDRLVYKRHRPGDHEFIHRSTFGSLAYPILHGRGRGLFDWLIDRLTR